MEEVQSVLLSAFQEQLALKGKIATRATYNSLETSAKGVASGGFIVEVKGGRGWFHIEAGKRANTKLPVKKEGDKFVLLEPLASWAKAKVPNIPYFLLARSIAKKARAGIPLTQPALEKAMPKVEKLVANMYAKAFMARIAAK